MCPYGPPQQNERAHQTTRERAVSPHSTNLSAKMASKQLGKLRQWGREVISSKEKTVLTQEFKEIEQDVELRRAGIERLYDACGEYHGYLQKKKEYPSVEEGVKMLPVDALGAVMMSHGEEYGDGSAFGQSLFNLGRAHCKIATLQESFALAFRDTYLASLEGALEEFSDYASQRKKLDSRRLAYDAAVAKAGKAKKEKEVREAEEEVTKAKLRYEETSTDVQARMDAIQANEVQQIRDLTQLLAAETHFVEKYLEVLRNTQDEWLDVSMIQQHETPRRKASPHAFAFGRSTPSISSTSRTTVNPRPSSTPGATAPSSEDDDDGDLGFSVRRHGSPANTPRPNSRGSTRSAGTAHRSKRSYDSAGSDAASINKRMSVAGWASSAVSSLSGSGRVKKDGKKDRGIPKEKDAGRGFASLGNNAGDESDDEGVRYDDGVGEDGLSRSFGSSPFSRVLRRTQSISTRQPGNLPNSSSSNSSFNSVSGSASPSPSAPRRLMRAMFDFSGSSDELSFRTGDEIIVVSEPKGGWSMGELSGRRGLFPIDYAEDVPAFRARIVPPPRLTSIAQRAQTDTASEDGTSIVSDFQDVEPSIRLYDEPFGDHHLAKSPMVAEHDHEHEPSVDMTDEGEDEMQGLFGSSDRTMPNGAPPVTFTAHGYEVGNAAGNPVTVNAANSRQPPALPQRKPSKKPPPPPPARRSTISASAAPAHGVRSGDSSVSAPASTANLAASVSFPPPPPVTSRRAKLRARSSTPSMQATDPSDTISPFDN
ncbi:hypothetical protein JB92DRAFT_3207391 [Gautieria morchelliformis]|nr:hypothetical protein JB92DRAFT_3207391 [Gautieria morchelliformis]